MFKENLGYKSNKLHNPKYKQPDHCLFNEVNLVTINMHLKQICHYRCLSYAPSHMILAYEHPNQRCSSLRVTSLKLIFLNIDHEAL